MFKKSGGGKKTTDEMIRLYAGWLDNYPLWSIEDPLSEHDWEGWQAITRELGGRAQFVGDDVFVTNPAIIRRAVAEGVGNAVLIKLNQVGTVTETLAAINEAQAGEYDRSSATARAKRPTCSWPTWPWPPAPARSKPRAPCRGERLAKYNQLLRIEDELGNRARYAGPHILRKRQEATK